MVVLQKQITNYTKYKSGYRRNFISQFVDQIEKSESFTIFGMPGSGKNDLFQSFDKNYEFWQVIVPKDEINFFVVFLDLAKLLDVSTVGFYKLLLSKLYRNIIRDLPQNGVHDKVEKIYSDAITNQDLFVIFSAVEDIVKVITREFGFKLCIIIHDFATLASFNKQFFNSIKSLRNVDLWKVVFAFSSDKDPLKIFTSDLLDELYSLFLNKRILLKLPNKKDAKLIIDEWERECGYKIPEKVRKSLFEISGGHPGYMKSANQVYLASNKKEGCLAEENLQKLSEESTIQARSEKFWIKFDKNYQGLLKKYVVNPQMQSTPEMKYLENTGIIINGDYKKVFSPLLEFYIKSKSGSPKDEIPVKEGVFIDPKTETVYIDGKPLKTEPTRSEFKILKLLYTNNGEIVKREELAEVIWGKNVIEKYSDWAIDRTISRIRKKLGDTARNPRFIQTIKGRGLRLISQ
ncbi:MAG: winged helix-turn-helix domain-containing protein [Patescibacteria group bacterium]|nr:winged helix-turn-helix domain-containing protein [Patescibacteria group bacterium]